MSSGMVVDWGDRSVVLLLAFDRADHRTFTQSTGPGRITLLLPSPPTSKASILFKQPDRDRQAVSQPQILQTMRL
jgi:hypothetical protein